MSTAQIEAVPPPDDLIVAEFELVLNIEDEHQARVKAAKLFTNVRRTFYAEHIALALLYDLKFEITRSHSESWKFIGKVRLKLKRNWKALKKRTPKAAAAATAIIVTVAGYPDFREGVIQIAEDVQTVVSRVVQDDSKASPGVIKYFDCRRPNAKDKRHHDH